MKLFTILLFLLTLSLHATDQQFYFIAKKAPMGSLSSFGQDREAVYLRWDTVEGTLPQEIVMFQLIRDGELLKTFDLQYALGSKTIDGLYSGSAQERRKLETLASLSKYGASKTPREDVALSNFSSAIQTELSNNYWAFLASRVDFNVARANQRAYLDTGVSSGTHEYELIALSAQEEPKRIAYLEINLDQDLQSAGAVDLEQVFKAKCTSPEYALDHFTVALNWKNAGTNRAEKFLNSVSISGYDIYRTLNHHATDAELGLDIATLAAQSTHNDQGIVQIDSLEKVNDSLVMLEGDSSNPEETVVFLETQDQLKKAGIKAGDSIVYYVVSRDFTGNYGPTQSILVQVPDLTPPPTPWMIQVANDTVMKKSVISFDAVNQQNYLKQFQNYRKFCLHDELNKLYFVDLDKACGEAEVEVNLDVETYLVYRFNSFEEASNFSDADADGYSDSDESNETECRNNLFPAGAKNYLLKDLVFEHEMYDNGHEIVRFSDVTPFEDMGEVYWYRIATKSRTDNVVSPLSGPIRLYFPDRELPKREDIKAELTHCESGFRIAEGEPYLRHVTHLATDETGYADTFSVECLKDDAPETMNFDIVDGVALNSTDVDIFAWQASCLQSDVKGKVKISFKRKNLKGTPVSIKSHIIEDGELHTFKSGLSIYSCKYKYALKGKSCLRKEDYTAVIPGMVLGDTPKLTVPTEDCVELGYTHEGRYTKIGQECNTTIDQDLLIGVLPAEVDNICLSVREHNSNNQISAAVNLPCFSILPTKKPSAPSLQSLTFTDNTAYFTWLPPVERVNGTLLELTKEDSNESYTIFTPHVDYELDGVRLENNQSISDLVNEENWCLRARSVAKGASVSSVNMLSDWSAKLCALRSASTSLPSYLAWPKIKRVLPDSERLRASYNGDKKYIELSLSTIDTVIANEERAGFTLIDEPCTTLEKKLEPHLNYVVYRQSISPDGTVSRMIQASSLLFKVNLVSLNQSVELANIYDVSLKTAGRYCVIADFNMNITQERMLGTELVYIDGLSELPGYSYRFEVVYFDDFGEIIGSKLSDTVQIPETPVFYIPIFSTPIFTEATPVFTPVQLIGGN